MSERSDRLTVFLGKAEKAWGEGKLEFVSKAKGVKVGRFSTGIFDLDLKTGGGWPWGRFVLLKGPFGSGKSTTCLLACKSVQEYDATTRRHISEFEDETKFEPCRALYVDQESVIDLEWAKSVGFDPDWHVLCRPGCAEEAVDIITQAIMEDLFDVVILDSIAAMVPTKEIDDSAGDAIVGVHAKLMAKAFRKWQQAITSKGDRAPTFICTNQIREKIGVMFGNPETLPGGRAQEFYSSIHVRLSPFKMEGGEDKTSAYSNLSGCVSRNKTYVQKLDFEFSLACKNDGIYEKGSILNAIDVFKRGKALGLVGHTYNTGRKVIDEEATKAKEKFNKSLGKTESTDPIMVEEIIKVSKDEEMIAYLHDSPDDLRTLWKTIMDKIL